MAAVGVDGVLDRVRALLGEGAAPGWPSRSFGASIPPVASWTGQLSEAAHQVSGRLDGKRSTIAVTHAAVAPLVDQANQIAESGRRDVNAVIAQWRDDQQRLAPVAGTAAGQAALLQLGQMRINEAVAVVNATRSRYMALASQVDALTAQLPPTSDGDHAADDDQPRIMLVDNETSEPEPWEYNLDFTSGVRTGSFVNDGGQSAGEITSVDDAWNELNRCFNCNFPMGGAPRDLPQVGDELPLEIEVLGVDTPLKFPVRVTQLERTADQINIEFVTLPGHVDGPGSTIHFRFYESGGELHLGVRGVITEGPGTEGIPIISPGLRTGYTGVAVSTWQPYIDRLTRHVAQAEGINTYGGVP